MSRYTDLGQEGKTLILNLAVIMQRRLLMKIALHSCSLLDFVSTPMQDELLYADPPGRREMSAPTEREMKPEAQKQTKNTCTTGYFLAHGSHPVCHR